MDLNTGKTYSSLEEAKAAGVSESDLVLLDRNIKTVEDMRNSIPKIKFPKNIFGVLKVGK